MAQEGVRETEQLTQAMFPTTRWSQVCAVQDSQQRAEILNQLCVIYWKPLYAFLRRHGETPADAKDLVQGFLARIVDRGVFETVAREKGRLRTFLITSLRNHMLNQKEHERAQRRGGGKAVVPIDTEEAERLCAAELAEGISPEIAYDRNWARTVLTQALGRLGEEHKVMRKEKVFSELSAFLDGAGAQEYEGAGKRLGMTANAVAVAVFRMKKRLRDLILEEVTETVGSRDEAEAEMREVLNALAVM